MSIGKKFSLWVLAALLLGTAVSIPVFFSIEMKQEEKKLDFLTKLTGPLIHEALVTAMLERRSGGLDEKLKSIKQGSRIIADIRLLNPEAIVKNSTDPASIGAQMNIPTLTGNVRIPPQSFLKNGKKTYRFVQLVPNDPPCHRCHSTRTKYNGMIMIDFSLQEILDHVREEIFAAAAVMLVSLIIIAGIVIVLWTVLLGKRLNAVIDKVRLIKEGIYRADRETEGNDEFARLEHDFNKMAEAIQTRNAEKETLLHQLSVTNADLLQEIGLRNQWEAKLREQKTFSDSLIENSALATFVLDRQHRVVLWNSACEKLTGISSFHMVGTDNHWKPFYRVKRETLADLVLDGRNELSGLYEKHSASTLIANGLHGEGWYQQLNGRDRYIIFDAAPIRDSSGELTAAIETLQDVTEQKNMEQALARSEAQLRTIIETEPECVKVVSAEGTILEMNRAGLSMVEAEKAGDIIGKSMISFIVPEYHPAVRSHMNRVLQGERDSIEFEIIGLKGRRTWVSTSAAPLRNGQGEINAVLAVTRDVRERKQGEKKLQEQLQLLQTLMETIPMPVFYKDADGVYQGCNKAFEQMVGLPKESVIGKTVYDIARSELADVYQKKDRELFDNPGVQLYEHSVKQADGTDRDVIFNKATFTDSFGRIAGLIGVVQDITERKKAEEALIQTNEVLQTLVNASPSPIMVLDPDGKVTVWNPAAEMVFGWTAAEAIGLANPIVPEHKKEEFMGFHNRIMRGEAITAIDVQRQRKDGTRLDLILSTAPLRDGQGRVIGSMALYTDITDRKRADEVIRRNYDTQTAINWILHISLAHMPLEKILKQALDLILSIPWLSFQSRGAIFLVENEMDKLVMKAQRGLSNYIKHECAVVPFGKCHCGMAAARSEIQFSSSIDDRHETRYEGITGHGHYCVPIKQGSKVFGVINIYIREGHVRDHKEAEFLTAIANALAGVIQRSRAEAALEESEKRYRTLAEAAHDVIFILNREGRIEYVNSFGANLFRTSPQKQIGKNIAEFFPPEITQRQTANISKVFETGESVYVENPLAFPGVESWLGTWLVPLKDGDTVTAVLGVSRDITERRRSEQERENLIQELQRAVNVISRSHKEWQDTFDSIMDMIAIIDKDFTILKANKAFAAFFGLHPRQVVNRKCYEFHHETSAPIPGCPHHRTLSDKNASAEEIVDKKTNKIFRITTFPYFSPEGEIIGSIHISRDVTQEKEREMRLIMSERLAALGQMASGIAHEINNPLASIAGCSEGLLSRVRKGKYDFKLFETYLNIIQEEIFRCKSITTGMLSFVRKTTYEKKEVNVNDLLDRTVEIISFQGRLKDVKIEKKYNDVSPPVLANEGELRQVFLAVITNALDAMRDKGSLLLESGTNGNALYVRIIDSGPGIAENNITKIFDPFYTTKSETGGTGLGLSIARKIIHNHNGTIEAASQPGNGSVFTITLPVS